jgi:hypothetical protein
MVNLADAVVAQLSGLHTSPEISPQRRFRAEFDLAELSQLRVTVVPVGVTRSGGTRSGATREIRIDVAFQQRLASDQGLADLRIRELLGLIEDMASQVHRSRIDDPAAVCTEAELDPTFAQEHLREHHVFTGVIRLTHRILGIH